MFSPNVHYILLGLAAASSVMLSFTLWEAKTKGIYLKRAENDFLLSHTTDISGYSTYSFLLR
jgi:hypothetical protein